ncbi:UNVERIFIED_CONTAM: pseudouridine-5'-phosphate glycosidase [Paenibacillus sp. PvR008]
MRKRTVNGKKHNPVPEQTYTSQTSFQTHLSRCSIQPPASNCGVYGKNQCAYFIGRIVTFLFTEYLLAASIADQNVFANPLYIKIISRIQGLYWTSLHI